MTATMAPRKKKPAQPAQKPTPQEEKTERQAGGHKNRAIGFRPPADMFAAIERVQQKRRSPSLAHTVLLLVEDALIALGELPSRDEEGGV